MFGYTLSSESARKTNLGSLLGSEASTSTTPKTDLSSLLSRTEARPKKSSITKLFRGSTPGPSSSPTPQATSDLPSLLGGTETPKSKTDLSSLLGTSEPTSTTSTAGSKLRGLLEPSSAPGKRSTLLTRSRVAAPPPPSKEAWGTFLSRTLSSWITLPSLKTTALVVGAASLGLVGGAAVATAAGGYSIGTFLTAVGGMTVSQIGSSVTQQLTPYGLRFLTKHLGETVKNSEKVKAVLEAKLPTGYLNRLASKLGVTVEDLTVGDAGSFFLEEAAKLGLSGFTGYVGGKVISLGIKGTVMSGRALYRLYYRIADMMTEDLELHENPDGSYRWELQADPGKNDLVDRAIEATLEETSRIEGAFSPSTSAPGPPTSKPSLGQKRSFVDRLDRQREARREALIRARRGQPPVNPETEKPIVYDSGVDVLSPEAREAEEAREAISEDPLKAAAQTVADVDGYLKGWANKQTVAAALGTMALGAVGMALGLDLGSVAGAGAAALDTAVAHQAAASMVFSVVTKAGVDSVLSRLNVPDAQREKLRKLHRSILTRGDAGAISNFLARLTGRKIYSKRQLENLSEGKLKAVARSYGVTGKSREVLIAAILAAETNESAKIADVVSGVLRGTVSSVVAGTLTAGFSSGLAQVEADRALELRQLEELRVASVEAHRLAQLEEQFQEAMASQAAKSYETAQRTIELTKELNLRNDEILAQIDREAFDRVVADETSRRAQALVEEAREAALNAANDKVLAEMMTAQIREQQEAFDRVVAAEVERRIEAAQAAAVEAAAQLQVKAQLAVAQAATTSTLEVIGEKARAYVEGLAAQGYEVVDPDASTKLVYDGMVNDLIQGTPEALEVYSQQFASVAAQLGYQDMDVIPPQVPTYGPHVGVPGVFLEGVSLAPQTIAAGGVTVESAPTVASTLASTEVEEATSNPLEGPLHDPDVLRALEEFKITPAFAYISQKAGEAAVKQSVASLLPGVGQAIFGSIDAINVGLKATGAATYIKEFADRLEAASKGATYSKPAYYEYLRSARIPDFTKDVDAVSLKSILEKAIYDQTTNGPDTERFITNLGRMVLWGSMSEGTGVSDWMVKAAGQAVYRSLYG